MFMRPIRAPQSAHARVANARFDRSTGAERAITMRRHVSAGRTYDDEAFL